MKNLLKKSIPVMAMLVMGSVTINAQGFLKKLSKGVDKALDTTEKVAGTATTVADALPTDTASQKKIDWTKIPVFEAYTILEVDDNKQPVLNEDGTQRKRIILRDQFGNSRSPESVKAQHKAISKAVTTILKKVGVGAGAGALTSVVATGKVDANAAIGAGVGAGVGLLASADDIKLIKKHKKSLKEQEKLIESYSKSFTDEGLPVDAKADLSNVNGLDFTKGESVSMSSAQIKTLLESEEFNNMDTSAWDIDI